MCQIRSVSLGDISRKRKHDDNTCAVCIKPKVISACNNISSKELKNIH